MCTSLISKPQMDVRRVNEKKKGGVQFQRLCQVSKDLQQCKSSGHYMQHIGLYTV